MQLLKTIVVATAAVVFLTIRVVDARESFGWQNCPELRQFLVEIQRENVNAKFTIVGSEQSK